MIKHIENTENAPNYTLHKLFKNRVYNNVGAIQALKTDEHIDGFISIYMLFRLIPFCTGLYYCKYLLENR